MRSPLISDLEEEYKIKIPNQGVENTNSRPGSGHAMVKRI
jgi:hypothetical protein